MKGKFITFEGTEGSGKTSVIKKVKIELENLGYKVLTTREPGGIKISEQIRSILLDKENQEMDSKTEALLFAASRRQHLVEIIIPALKNGYVVLCDRFVDSSLIYQGIAREIGIDQVYDINYFAIEDALPDLTIFVDVRPEVGLERVFSTPGREVNRLDLEDLDFHQKIYQGYLGLVQKYDRIKCVNGEQSLDKVVEDTIELIKLIL
ncbi:dTMP kinase [Hujiaoplasma nucleasis]|uniref:Thymidylate kinase n=1 Tax=Hujiaoplasma nucleasis TaxID=2725268 RepID=A0A7L6N6V0_9MOLU|nr:dTMP kinase [Hujiaoplasma nucleasis]